ncbi:MAG: GNAT family N-acetyltransferase [Candidatus Micrarchaeia archaeon]|jgi:ribosomal-protein-alanine N-acetyltransferase
MDEKVAVEIRNATEKELYSVVVLTRKYFPYAGFNFAEIRRRLHEKGVVYFVAKAGGSTVGYIDFKVNRWSIKILGLAVLEEFRRKGIAKKMLKKTLAWAKAHAKKKIYLFVDAENLAAQTLYASEGFSSKGRLGRLIAGRSVLLLYKDLQAKQPEKPGRKNMLPAIARSLEPRRDIL